MRWKADGAAVMGLHGMILWKKGESSNDGEIGYRVILHPSVENWLWAKKWTPEMPAPCILTS